MNVVQAKSLSIPFVLERIGSSPLRVLPSQSWYLSPLRNEQTASLHVHTGKNIWYDFGEGRGGSVIDLAVAYLSAAGQPACVADALCWLAQIVGGDASARYTLEKPAASNAGDDGRWVFRSDAPVTHLALVRYLKERGIPLAVARKHLREVKAAHSKSAKSVFGLGFKNDEGGWELRNPYLKAAIAPKTISFIRGSLPKPSGIHLFEGAMDFLSVLAREKGKPLVNDAIVLNSLSCLAHAMPYIQGYGYRTLFSWMDNDKTGVKATEALAEFAASESIACLPMNPIYKGFKDVNQWHVATPLNRAPQVRP